MRDIKLVSFMRRESVLSIQFYAHVLFVGVELMTKKSANLSVQFVGKGDQLIEFACLFSIKRNRHKLTRNSIIKKLTSAIYVVKCGRICEYAIVLFADGYILTAWDIPCTLASLTIRLLTETSFLIYLTQGKLYFPLSCNLCFPVV